MQILGDFCQVCQDGSYKDWKKEEKPPDDVEMDGDSHRVRYECKKRRLILTALDDKEAGFLVCLARYLQLRVPTVHEFCAICDKPFQQLPMMMRTVCPEELCTYQFSEYPGAQVGLAQKTCTHTSLLVSTL